MAACIHFEEKGNPKQKTYKIDQDKKWKSRKKNPKIMNDILTEKISKTNFLAFVWHGIFLSLASNFMETQTIIPSLLIKAGGNSILLGLLTAIMIGGAGIIQLVFAGFLSNKTHKKNSLILGINLRIVALLLLSLLLFKSQIMNNTILIISIFILISIFSFSGSFANISYVDIIGKSILNEKRKQFFSIKQTINSLGIFISAVVVSILLKHLSYPVNYGILFLTAGILLFIASMGFLRIDEISSDVKQRHNVKEYIKKISHAISHNPNLKNYLFIVNNLGLGLSFIPFMILFAKNNFGLSYNLIGEFLIFKTVGMLVPGFIFYKKSQSFEYKKLLYFSLILGVSLPILSLLFSHNLLLYKLVFLLSGTFITTYKIAASGVLIEISDNENRAIYTGISGAGKIIPLVFPLIAGILISVLGNTVTFIIISVIISSSFLFITKLNFQK
jgi:MFS family permease